VAGRWPDGGLSIGSGCRSLRHRHATGCSAAHGRRTAPNQGWAQYGRTASRRARLLRYTGRRGEAALRSGAGEPDPRYQSRGRTPLRPSGLHVSRLRRAGVKGHRRASGRLRSHIRDRRTARTRQPACAYARRTAAYRIGACDHPLHRSRRLHGAVAASRRRESAAHFPSTPQGAAGRRRRQRRTGGEVARRRADGGLPLGDGGCALRDRHAADCSPARTGRAPPDTRRPQRGRAAP